MNFYCRDFCGSFRIPVVVVFNESDFLMKFVAAESVGTGSVCIEFAVFKSLFEYWLDCKENKSCGRLFELNYNSVAVR